MSVSEVAAWTDEIVRHIPKHSMVQVLLVARLVQPSEGESGRCPKCGPVLPAFSFPPPFSGPKSFGRYSYTDYEWTLHCLVDGVHRNVGRDIAPSVLLRSLLAGCGCDVPARVAGGCTATSGGHADFRRSEQSRAGRATAPLGTRSPVPQGGRCVTCARRESRSVLADRGSVVVSRTHLTRRSTCTEPDGVVVANVLRLVPAGQQAFCTGTCAAAGCGFRGSGDAAELEPCKERRPLHLAAVVFFWRKFACHLGAPHETLRGLDGGAKRKWVFRMNVGGWS
jgi:hypothetical protein